MSLKGLIKDLEDIVSKQKVLEDLKEKLHILLDDINQVTIKCTSWIQKTDSITYLELKEYLTDKISEYIQQCLNFALENSNPETKKEHIKEDSRIQSPSSSSCKDDEKRKTMEEEIMNLQQQFNSLDKHTKWLAKESQETSAQITEELHLASDFMSTLQTKIETLTEEIQNSVQNQDKKMEEFSDKIEKCFKQINLLAKQSDDNLLGTEIQNCTEELEQCQGCLEKKSEVKNLTEELEKCQVCIESLNEEVRNLKGKLVHAQQLIKSGEDEIKRLKSEKEKTKKKLDEHIQKIHQIFANIDRPFRRYPFTTMLLFDERLRSFYCERCHTATYEWWYIKRLKELCKNCWMVELEV
ncbi:uncharacterized protein LOC106072215 isoform X1 [Biomphalaria glabrata]|uniref:Uncharacterized protein LOC106072215 isoform X1 n=1 Tax=Biomphalaria glabrata TaxID=6526 RepID=A0A9W2Z4A1_BIOGL|nr:uncharacterized protein LOC106072215 isoform X1 [Biomphalaria glabrata]XP_055869741.1 uncharacterized protein LOC106072215 isoform X1 [Biomphalaria glabrata]XP_055869743.1 uncharacterized protein LOC106072215 isoform X1 [Biomphalaria glabrata]XP_055869744.1 uncharacterized protein LOC106072215 isoform X1 [Biomphalaria glabrata]